MADPDLILNTPPQEAKSQEVESEGNDSVRSLPCQRATPTALAEISSPVPNPPLNEEPSPARNHHHPLGLGRVVARSRSVLWRPWSPALTTLSEYERTRGNFSWLGPGEKPGDGSEAHRPGQASGQSRRGRRPNPTILVGWTAPTDPSRPDNWPKQRKWLTTLLIGNMTFMSLFMATAIAPALQAISSDLGITNDMVTYLCISAYLPTFLLGPTLLAPCQHRFGKVAVTSAATLLFAAFNAACGFADTALLMVILRALSGFGASASIAFGRSIISDCWVICDERDIALSVDNFLLMLGPIIGPLAAASLSQSWNWRWIFWSSSILSGAFALAAALLLRETSQRVILANKARRIRRELGDVEVYSRYQVTHPSVWKNAMKAVVAPIITLFTEPIVATIGFLQIHVFSFLYFILITLPHTFSKFYHLPPAHVGPHYVPIGIGLIGGAMASNPLMGQAYRILYNKLSGPCRAEYFIPLCIPACIVSATGFLFYGLAANTGTHWFVLDICLAGISFGCVLFTQCCEAYLAETFGDMAPRAMTASAILWVAGTFGTSLLAPILLSDITIVCCMSILSGIVLVKGLLTFSIVWLCGPSLRRRVLPVE